MSKDASEASLESDDARELRVPVPVVRSRRSTSVAPGISSHSPPTKIVVSRHDFLPFILYGSRGGSLRPRSQVLGGCFPFVSILIVKSITRDGQGLSSKCLDKVLHLCAVLHNDD